jgi:outer membrane lipoprotein SlyB
MTHIVNTRSAMAGALAAVSLAITGCAGSYGAGETTASGVGQTSTVYEGVVVQVRDVTIKPDGSLLGTGTGAVLGGIAGSQVGGGDAANAAGAIAGAVIGGVVGNQADKRLNTRPGYAYTIRMDRDDSLKEIVQGADILIQPGTPVFVTFGPNKTTVAPKVG